MTRILETLRRTEDTGPNFRGRLTYVIDHLPCIRAYIHNAGIGEAFGFPKGNQIEVNAEKHLLKMLIKNRHVISGAVYLLAAIWGDSGAKMIDLFKYSGISRWPGNPDVAAFVFRNGVYLPNRKEIGCGDMTIILGREEEYRRKTRDLNEYVEHPPTIDCLVRDTSAPFYL